MSEINYCPVHGDLLNRPGDGADARSYRCRNAHNIDEIRGLAPEPSDTDEREALTLIVRDVHNYDGRPGYLALSGPMAQRIADAILAAGFHRQGQITEAMLKSARKAVRREMEARTYDRHAYDKDVFKEGVADIARAAVEAAEEARRG